MKIAKIVPIYKAKDKTDMGNYRPISTMVYMWLYTYSPIFYIKFVSKLSRQSVSPSTDHKSASSLSVNCHDSQFHRLPSM